VTLPGPVATPVVFDVNVLVQAIASGNSPEATLPMALLGAVMLRLHRHPDGFDPVAGLHQAEQGQGLEEFANRTLEDGRILGNQDPEQRH